MHRVSWVFSLLHPEFARRERSNSWRNQFHTLGLAELLALLSREGIKNPSGSPLIYTQQTMDFLKTILPIFWKPLPKVLFCHHQGQTAIRRTTLSKLAHQGKGRYPKTQRALLLLCSFGLLVFASWNSVSLVALTVPELLKLVVNPPASDLKVLEL